MTGNLRLIFPSLPEFSDIEGDLRQLWTSGLITTAGFTRRFEEAVAERLGVRHVVAVNSCTSGLILTLRALDLRGKVVVPAFTFTASGLAALWSGLVPAFADVDPHTFTLDPLSAEANLSEDTAAIMPVNVFGLPPDYQPFLDLAARHKLKLVFDSAQGLGSSYGGRPAGGFGDAEIFSLSPTKVVTSVEGGLVTTDDATLAGRVRQMRDYGKSADGEDICYQGLSARFSEFHAIVGYHAFRKLDALRSRRQALIKRYRAELKGVPGISFQSQPTWLEPSFNYFVIRVEADAHGMTRDTLHQKLKAVGIETKRYFHPPLHRQRAYAHLPGIARVKLPVAESLAESCLALPLFANLTEEQLGRVTHAIRAALALKPGRKEQRALEGALGR